MYLPRKAGIILNMGWDSVCNGSGASLWVGCRSGSSSEPYSTQSIGPGGQMSRTIRSSRVQWKSPNLSELGRLYPGLPVGPSVDSYIGLVLQ